MKGTGQVRRLYVCVCVSRAGSSEGGKVRSSAGDEESPRSASLTSSSVHLIQFCLPCPLDPDDGGSLPPSTGSYVTAAASTAPRVGAASLSSGADADLPPGPAPGRPPIGPPAATTAAAAEEDEEDAAVLGGTGRRSAPPPSLAPPCRDPPFPSEIGGWDDPAAGTGTGTCAGFVCAFATGCCVPRGPPGYPPIILGGGGPCGWGGAWAQGCGGYA